MAYDPNEAARQQRLAGIEQQLRVQNGVGGQGGFGYQAQGYGGISDDARRSLAAMQHYYAGGNPQSLGNTDENALRGAMGPGFFTVGDGQQDRDLAIRFAGDQRAYENAVSQRNMYQTGGVGYQADSSRYHLGGNANWAGDRISQMDARAGAMSAPSRYQPAVDLAGMYQAGAAGQMAGVGGQIGSVASQLGGVAGQIGGAAQGAGYQGQLNAAGGLYAMGQAPQGPSAAEMAMRAQAGQALQGQAAMAGSARGANAGLAMQNAAAGNAAIQGNLVAQLGQQRAAEDLAYRAQRMQALGASGDAYGRAMGSQVSAYGQQAGVMGSQAQAYGGAGQMYGGAGAMAGEAGRTALQGQQMDLARDEAARAYYGMGNSLAGTQLGADMGYDAARTGNFLHYSTGKDARDAADKAFGRQLLGGALSAAGAVAGGMVGGPGGAIAGGAAGNALGGAITR